MKIETQMHRIGRGNLARASLAEAKLDGITINLTPIMELLAYWRTGGEAASETGAQ